MIDLRIANKEIATATSDNERIATSVYELSNGNYTTWWTCGISTFEITEDDLPRMLEMVGGAMEVIAQEKEDNNVVTK